MLYFLSFIILLLSGLLFFICLRFYQVLKIIAVFEDDLSDNIQALDNVEKSLDGIINLQMFFDSTDIQYLVREALDRIKLAKLHVGTMSKRFTDRSKQKYYFIEEVNEFEEKQYQVNELY